VAGQTEPVRRTARRGGPGSRAAPVASWRAVRAASSLPPKAAIVAPAALLQCWRGAGEAEEMLAMESYGSQPAVTKSRPAPLRHRGRPAALPLKLQ
jgi:hypothetical protein